MSRTTYTVRTHPELDDLSTYDEDELNKVIGQYKKWYNRNVNPRDRKPPNQAAWAYAIYHTKDFIDQNMVKELRTMEDTQGTEGDGYELFPDKALFTEIDTIREALLETTVHPSLFTMEPVLLMDILNKLEICTRHVIQNTSIQRLHKKSWVHADALRGHGGADALRVSDAAFQPPASMMSQPEADISTLLREMQHL